MNQTWSLVVFCYNEVGTLSRVVDKLVSTFEHYRPGQYEILIVDDGSTDGSADLVRRIASQYAVVKPLLHATNRGIGHALRTGYAQARYENLTAVPADGQFDTDELIPYLNLPAETFVSFYRLENTTYTLARNALSYANRLINRLFLGLNLHDVNWVKIYKTGAVQALPIVLESSLIDSDLCAKLITSGHRVRQIESVYHPREAGASKGASWNVVRLALGDTLTLARILRTFKHEQGSPAQPLTSTHPEQS